MLARQEWLSLVNCVLLVIDEAQAIKNPGTNQTRAVKKLAARARIALTGTPVENRLGDLWSIFDFLNPGLLGSAKVFKSFVGELNARKSDQFGPLRRLVAPYILRRMKTDRSIIADLPDKVETTRFCNLTRRQAQLYEQVVGAMRKSLDQSDGIKRRALVRKRSCGSSRSAPPRARRRATAATRPRRAASSSASAKSAKSLPERQERVLVFTQFRENHRPDGLVSGARFRAAGPDAARRDERAKT